MLLPLEISPLLQAWHISCTVQRKAVQAHFFLVLALFLAAIEVLYGLFRYWYRERPYKY